MKKSIRSYAALLLVLTFLFAVFSNPVFAANEPSVDYTGEWNSAKNELTLHAKVDNPKNTFYSGSVALDYDKSLFEFVESSTNPSAKDKFAIIDNDVTDDSDDENKGHILTDFAYFDETGGLEPGSTPTAAYDLKFKLKDGKTVQDVKNNSIKLSDDQDYLDSLGDPYKDGPVVLYCSKDEDDDERTEFSSDDADNKAKGSVNIPLNAPVTGVTVTPETASIPKGRKVTLQAKVSPDNATDPEVEWSSSDESIAKVNPKTGVVTGISPGKAIITAKTKDGGYTDTAEITVTEKVIDKILDSAVTTEAGTAPVLPTRVKVEYSDGTEGEVPVTWDAVSPSSYASKGSFEVKGTVAGIDDPAKCKVTVTAKSGNNTNNNNNNNNGSNGNNGSNARTGDNIRAYVIMSALLIVSVIVIAAIVISRKKKKAGEEDDQ